MSKTPGQILYDAIQDYYVNNSEEGSALRNRCVWEKHPTSLAKEAHEHAAKMLTSYILEAYLKIIRK
jgi:hypothetical protein